MWRRCVQKMGVDCMQRISQSLSSSVLSHPCMFYCTTVQEKTNQIKHHYKDIHVMQTRFMSKKVMQYKIKKLSNEEGNIQQKDDALIREELKDEEIKAGYEWGVDPDHFGTMTARPVKKKRKSKPSKNKTSVVQEDEFANANVFGTLADAEEYPEEFEDINVSEKIRKLEPELDMTDDHHIRLSATNRKNSPVWYGMQMEKLDAQGKVYEAIEMLDTMIKVDRVMPTPYVFATLLGILGRAGYTRKAFQVFNQMKKMGVEVAPPVYTALFNACANSPFDGDGLKRLCKLHKQIKEKGIILNPTNYASLVKAYGVGGDILGAFAVVDEMIEMGCRPDDHIYISLLIACNSDKKAGFKHAIEVWRKMRHRRILGKNILCWNNLLRAARDCGVGDPEFANELIPQQSSESVLDRISESDKKALLNSGTVPSIKLKNAYADGNEHKQWWKYEIGQPEPRIDSEPLPSRSVVTTAKSPETDLVSVDAHQPPLQDSTAIHMDGSVSSANMHIPDMLDPKSRKRHNLVSLGDLSIPENRLALLGGLPGVMRLMRRDKVQPDIKTFTLLLETIPSTREAETDLLNTMSNHNVKTDIDMLNLLIRKRCLRNDIQGSRFVLDMVGSWGLVPNIQTFGCLALGCRRQSDALRLLRDMANMSMVPNQVIYNTLAYQSNKNFHYRLMLLKHMKRHGVKPEAKFITNTEYAVQAAKHNIVKVERGEPVKEYFGTEHFREEFKRFMLYYKPWLLSMELDKMPHPWDQYKRPSDGSHMVNEDAMHDDEELLTNEEHGTVK